MSDTKICPFCAETIKAAAIKCRYCGSDLVEGAAPEPVADSPVEPVAGPPVERPVEAAVEPAVDVIETRALPRPGWFLPAAAVSAVATVAFVVLTLLAWLDGRDLDRADEARDQVRATVPAQIEALLSYDFSSFDEDLDAGQEALTDDFRADYAKEVDALRARVLEKKLAQVADVVSAAVVEATPDRVDSLLLVNTTTTEEGSVQARVMQNRINVRSVRTNGQWLIDCITFPGTDPQC